MSGSRALGTAIAFMVGGGLAWLGYLVVVAAANGLDGARPGAALSGDDARSFATGELARLVRLDDAPVQPDIAMRDEAGAEVTLEAFRGRVALVNLWATWCPPCVREMPSLDRLAASQDPERFVVAPVALDAYIEDARDFFDRAEITHLPLYHENTFALATALRASGLPVTVIYDPNGVEVARLPADAEWDSPEAVAFIEAVIADAFPEPPDAAS